MLASIMFRTQFHFIHTSCCVYWRSETLHRDVCLLLLSSRVIKYALIFMHFSYVTRSMSDVCGNVTMNILCEDMHILALLIFDSSLLRGFWSVSISSLRKTHKSDNDHSLHDVRYRRILRDGYSLTIGDQSFFYEYVSIFDIVVGMIVKRAISFVYLLSFINQMQFLSSDLISSPSFIIDENMIHF